MALPLIQSPSKDGSRMLLSLIMIFPLQNSRPSPSLRKSFKPENAKSLPFPLPSLVPMTSYNAILFYAELHNTTLSWKTSSLKSKIHKNGLTTAPATLRSQLPKISLTFLLSMEIVLFIFLKPSRSLSTETVSSTQSPNSLLLTKSIKTFKKSHFTQNLTVMLEK
jgi:hypothetical protein